MSNYNRGQKLSVPTPAGEFTQIPNIILTVKNVTPVEKLVLIYVHRYANIKSWVFYFSKIGEDIGVNERTIGRVWSKLVKVGLIQNNTINYDLVSKMQKIEPDKLYGSDTGQIVQSPVQIVPLNRTNCTPINKDINTDYKEEDINKERQPDKLYGTQVVADLEPTPLGATVQSATGNKLNSNKNDMITKEMVLTEIKERGLKVQSKDGIVTIYQSTPNNGTQFKKGNYDEMLKYLLEFPSIIKPELKPQSIEAETPKAFIQHDVITSIEDFLSKFKEKQLEVFSNLNVVEFRNQTDDLKYANLHLQDSIYWDIRKNYRKVEEIIPVLEDQSLYTELQPQLPVKDYGEINF